MRIDKDLCIGCGMCVPYCPVDAIGVVEKKAVIDEDACVECGTCYRVEVCPKAAFIKEEITGPRIIRQVMSDPSLVAANTSVGGRGTVEMKTNDITGRFREGFAGMAVEVGRPGVSATIRQLESIAVELCRYGVQWEECNPITALLKDPAKGTFKEEYLDERVLSGILEFIVPTSKLEDVLETLEQVAKTIKTVFVVSVISKLGKNGEDGNLPELVRLGYEPQRGLKVNVGLGKPLYDFNQ